MLERQSHSQAYIALAAVCFFWGTTYLGIRMALESFPPATLLAIRYLISGPVLLAVALLKGAHIPKGRELWTTALWGAVIIGTGNGALVFAETRIPSGLAALFITTSPFWMIGVEALWPGGEKPRGPAIAGMCVGLAGSILLVSQTALDSSAGSRTIVLGFVLLQFGCAGWAIGSIGQRRNQTRAHPVVSGAVHQLAAGLAFLGPALALDRSTVRWTLRSGGALIYLIVFGSIVGYSAYAYALDRLPVTLVSLYTYINPIVAVFLGWLFYREPFGWREAAAMALVFFGVAIVKRYSRAPGQAAAEEPEPVT